MRVRVMRSMNMKLATGVFYASAILHQTCAALSKSHVYTFDKSLTVQSTSEPPSIPPSTARLLFAQRLGLSRFHSLNQADTNTIELINRLGGTHEQIFINGDQGIPEQKILIFVENVERPEDIFDAESAKPAFVIEHPPSPSQNLQLALDLLSQDRYLGLKNKRPCHVEFSKSKNKGLRGGINIPANAQDLNECSSKMALFDLLEKSDPVETLESIGNQELIMGSTCIIHVSMLEGLTQKDGETYDRVVRAVKDLLRSMRLPQSSGTVVLMPPNPKNPKRLSTSPYGTYTIPPTIQRRGNLLEEPLTAHAVRPLSSKNSHPSSAQTLKTSVLHKGVLPLCQPSKEKCITATNNCSGHGTPYKKPADPSANSAKECWTCRCENTVRTDKDGKVIKTTQWGGPSCRKKDVSVPFFLLAGLTVALVATVSWGIGLLYSIGQEDLPSVIGAGVTGPRAQK